MEGSVVNLDLEESISWSFHFMIYKFWFCICVVVRTGAHNLEHNSCVPGLHR
jgi:hypothetical protein